MLGICQWFHYEDYDAVTRCVQWMRELGVRHLRTGISWADFHRPRGPDWYRWQMEQLREFDILLSIWHTPPSIAEGNVCAGPPRRLEEYAEFVSYMIELYGHAFEHLELWNEPNNRYKWNFERFDPRWEKFSTMIRLAAQAARQAGMPTVLGGMIPVDPHWLNLIKSHGALENIDIVAIHGFPEMWWPDRPCWDWHDRWKGWDDKIQMIANEAEGRPIWITETGLATWDLPGGYEDRFQLQCQKLAGAADSSAERVYWYCLMDLDPDREAIEGFHEDENEYHLGLVRFDGTKKPSFDWMRARLGIEQTGGSVE